MFFPYLMILGSSSVRFSGLFFFFCSVSSFPLLLCSRPSKLIFVPCYWFSLLHLTNFLLNTQRRWHAGWLGSVFLFEKENVCCSNAAASFGMRSRLLFPPCFGHFFFPILSSHQHSRKMGMQLVSCSFLYGTEGWFQ